MLIGVGLRQLLSHIQLIFSPLMLSQHDSTYIVMFVENIGATRVTNPQCIRVVLACHSGPMCMCESKFKCAIFFFVHRWVWL